MYKKLGRYLFPVSSILLIILFIYTFYDNNRIKVVKQDIKIDNLPKDVENFKILQISDLHSKEFGTNQKRLINKINSINYDAIVFTGDMLASDKNNDYKPFFTLLGGIENKEIAFFVPGNTDPKSYYLNSDNKYEKTDFINGMEQRGISLLESIESVKIGNSKVSFFEFDFSLYNEEYINLLEEEMRKENNVFELEEIKHKVKLYKEYMFNNHKSPSNILIALTHYPVVDTKINFLTKDTKYTLKNYDLILAGHYHGGQIRIPFFGAIFIPEAWYERNGLFPPQNRVKGLWEYANIKQYVSAGLGSSDAVPLLRFRLFNTPEINLLTLTNKD